MGPRRRLRLREPAAVYLPGAFVIDCSVCLPWYVKDEANEFCDSVSRALPNSEVWVPSLWRPEFVSSVINAERRKRMTREQRRVVLANTAAALLTAERVATLPEGVARASAAIASGKALRVLDRLVETSRMQSKTE